MDADVINFFDNNVETIISGENIHIILENIEDKEISNIFRYLPESYKLKFLNTLSLNSKDITYRSPVNPSWEEFYEMYDGKFDERYKLEITIQGTFEEIIQNLGYKALPASKGNIINQIGFYQYNDSGDLIIYHNSPDKEIFGIQLDQYLEDLNIKYMWINKIELKKL